MSIKARRADLPDPTTAEIAHAGLYFQRFVAAVDDKGESARALFERLASWRMPDAYAKAFERWEKAALPGAGASWKLALSSPLALGLGNDGPAENGLTFHHTYGVPLIPGAALKGLTRRVLTRTLPDEQVAELLGIGGADEDSRNGHISFYDAWPVPTSDPLFLRDTITVHHPDYYSRRGVSTAPTDFDDPNPVPLLVVAPKTTFLFRLSISPDVPESAAWHAYVRAALEWGLANEGIGGKTNAGYGRLSASG